MSENTGILQVPITGKTSENLSNDTQKLVYVHIPKDKTQDISHVKVLPPKSNTGSTSTGTTNFIPLTGKINTVPVSAGLKKESSLPTSFTLTKTAKLSGGSNITFSPRPTVNSVTSKPRASILGNKLTLSPAITNSANIPMNPNTKSIKVSLSSNRNLGTSPTPSIFKTTTSISSSNVIVTQGMLGLYYKKIEKFRNLVSSSTQNISGNTITFVGSGSPSVTPLIYSPAQVRNPSILSQIPPKPPKSVILQSKILTGPKTSSPKVVSQKLLPVTLPAKQSNPNKTVVSYGTLLSTGVNSTSDSSGGVKRDSFGTPKREGGNYNSFTPPPLILQSGGNAKKLGNKKTGPTTISIVTGKSPSNSSGISVYPLSRTNNLNKPNMVNFKISNGQIQSENAVRFDGIICDSRPMLASPSVPNADSSDSTRDDDDQRKDTAQESTTFFKKVTPSVTKQSEQKDILQEAMSAMVSDSPEEQVPTSTSESVISQYNSETHPVPVSTSQVPDNIPVTDKKSNSNLSSKVSQSLHEPIPILVSKSVPVGGSAPVLLQGAMPVSGSNQVPVSVQGLIPVKVQPSPAPTTQGQTKPPDVQGLIIRTDSVTVRRRMGKDEERKESPKPDLSIIPILRNSSLENRSASSIGKTQRLNLLGSESFKDDFNKENSTACNTIGEEKPDENNTENDTGTVELNKNETTSESEEIDSEKCKETEVKELLKWENGTGSLIGSDLKFTLNEFDAVELVEDKALDEIKNQITSLPKNGEACHNNDSSATAEPSSLESSTTAVHKPLPTIVHVHHARKPNLNRKDDETAESVKNTDVGSKTAKNPYDICCCKNCGCYGLSSEFYKAKGNSFCTIACSEDYATKEAEWNKEKQRLEKTKNRLKKNKSNEKEVTEKPEIKPKDAKEKEQESTAAVVAEEESPLQSKEEITTASDVPKFQHPWQDTKSNSFSWVKYLEHCGKNKGVSRGAPLKLWNEPFPFGKNLFKTGMKMEGIDPQHQSLFCVMTVADVIGHRIRLHFDGYSEMYDFWCNANSPNIFQVGWCEKNGRKLETPPGIFNFSWKAYLEHCKALPAPRQAFATRNCTTITPPSNFRIGMKLEAEDRKNGWTCVATVADLMDSRILVHFDGWDKAFDTWFDVTSPFIHPIGWCAKSSVYLYPPKDYSNPDSFNWHEYLQEMNSMGVPARAFKTRPPREFKVDMKVEAVDKRNPMLIRVATIADTKDYKVMLHFDGWPDMYDYWVDDDSPDIHPPTWCNKTGHQVQPPLTPEQCAEDVDSGVGCGTQGCKGYGHVKGLIYNTHHTAYGCPYSLQNLNKDWESLLPDRLDPPSKEKKNVKCVAKPFINLDASKPIPEDISEDSQKKRVRKRRKFFDELSPPECSKTKITRMSSDDFNKSQLLSKPSTQIHSSSLNTNQGPSSSSSMIHPGVSGSDGLTPKKGFSSIEEVSVDTMVHQSIFNPGYHPNPPPPLPHTLERHKHIISAIKLLQRSELDSWGPEEVRDAMFKIPGCEISSEKFLDQDIDGESLLMLTQNDLVDLLGIKLGPAIKIMAMIMNLKNMP